jgi:trans-aconitate 2-methyltransferase
VIIWLFAFPGDPRDWRQSITEWDAAGYARQSELQEAMGEDVLALLDVEGSERVLDIGCGDGRITAEIAARVMWGSVVGVDSSHDMIALASSHFGTALRPNVRFEVADAHSLPFQEEFDLVVSFNASHWLPEENWPVAVRWKALWTETGLEPSHLQNAQCGC